MRYPGFKWLAGAVATLGLVAGASTVSAQETAPELRPDLRPRAQTNVTFDTFGLFGGPTVYGCMADEIAEDGARRCLRFDQSIANLGDGPFELRYSPPTYLTDPYMYQRILRTDGTWRERKAEQYELHPTHAHFHYRGFALSHLWRSDESGARLDPKPVRSGRKNGFCVMDIEQIRADAPESQYDGSGCLAAEEYKNGITRGWADTYTADLPDQYIEVSGVPDGYYVLETIADPDGTAVETDESNNSGSVLLRLRGDSAEIVRTVHDPTQDVPAPAPPPAGAAAPAPAPTPDPAPPATAGPPSPAPAAPATARPRARKKAVKRACRKPAKRKSARRATASRRKPVKRCKPARRRR